MNEALNKFLNQKRKAQALPGMEAADAEHDPNPEIYAPGFGRFRKTSFKRELLARIKDLEELVRLDHWRAAVSKAYVVEAMCKGMENYIKGATLAEMGQVAAMNKNAIIRHEDGKWNLYSHKGNLLGSHPTKEKAIAQEQAIEINKHK